MPPYLGRRGALPLLLGERKLRQFIGLQLLSAYKSLSPRSHHYNNKAARNMRVGFQKDGLNLSLLLLLQQVAERRAGRGTRNPVYG